MNEHKSPIAHRFSPRRWRHLWRMWGLADAARAGRAELDERGMNALIYESPREGVTVIVAREERAAQLREAWNQVFSAEERRLDACPVWGEARSTSECEKCGGDIAQCPIYGPEERRRQGADRA